VLTSATGRQPFSVSTLKSSSGGLTLIELLAVIVIVAILSLLLLPAGSQVLKRVERARCSANLRNLTVGAAAYLQEHKHWPQISPTAGDFRPYAKEWVKTLQPYGIPHETWICPTIQKILGGPDYKSDDDFRIDYYSTPFDSKELTPYLLKGQPWFVEKGGLHGRGNLVVFSDGSIKDLEDFAPKSSK
jgi:prepilin-type N-terminal cleavage/methylation domain-containing protein